MKTQSRVEIIVKKEGYIWLNEFSRSKSKEIR